MSILLTRTFSSLTFSFKFFFINFWKIEKLRPIGITLMLIPIINFFSGYLIQSLNINDNLFPRMNKNETKNVLIKNTLF